MKSPSQYMLGLAEDAEAAGVNELTHDPSSVTRIVHQPSLYYPGSGTDIAPLKLFTRRGLVSTVIYSDYTFTQDKVEHLLAALDGWSIQCQVLLNSQDFGVSAWAQFWPADLAAHEAGNPENAFCKSAVLYHASTRMRINFIALATEGTETLARLLDIGLNPAVVVVQDHGFGCNWTTFGGLSTLYEIARNKTPNFIYVAENTKPWPSYEQVSEYGPPEGAAGHCRALYRNSRQRSAT
jgi:hypothetical protein